MMQRVEAWFYLMFALSVGTIVYTAGSRIDVVKTAMSSFAAHSLVSTLRSRLLAGGIVAGSLTVTLVPSLSVAGPGEDTIPPVWFPRFRLECELLGFSARPSAGFGARAYEEPIPNIPIEANVKMAVVLEASTSSPRRIYLTDKHSENVKPSWFGESIGHYEGGDTLVVDTIGLAAGKYHYIDSFRTPNTEKLHVVERFTISRDGRTLTAIVTVEDPDTFDGRSHLNRHGARPR